MLNSLLFDTCRGCGTHLGSLPALLITVPQLGEVKFRIWGDSAGKWYGYTVCLSPQSGSCTPPRLPALAREGNGI